MSLSFGATTGSTGTSLFGGATASTPSTGLGGFGGFSFGNASGALAPAATTTTAGGFSFGSVKAAPTLAATTPATGFSVTGSLDSNQGAQKAVRFDTGNTSTLTSTVTPLAPLTLGGISATTAQSSTAPATGFSFSTPATSAPTLAGLLSGNKPALNLGTATTTSTTSATGFGVSSVGASLSIGTNAHSFGTTTAGVKVGGTTSLGLGGLGSTTTTSNIFGTTSIASVNQGLGGVDPKTASSVSTAAGGSSKTCDGRPLKDYPVDPIILSSIEEFTKHVKSQKNIRENISRMSSKPLCKVKEEMKNLQQQLMLVCSGLQKNSAAIEKLKKEATQELKYAEMAQRTKDTPPGLQYENTAPTEYFHRLTEEFEMQMMLYRQQILDTENHLISLNQSAMLTPQELSQLFGKLNDGFTALASQLQVVHEAVKDQKEKYLEYRKLYHGDTKDIFARHRKVQKSITKSVPSTIGPTPFSSGPGIGTFAISSQPAPSQQPPGMFTAGIGAPGFGATQQGFGQTSSVCGGSLFGTDATTGSGTTFGGSSAPVTGLFGGTGGSAFGSTGLAATPALNFSPAAATCQTQKPFGSKRGKNA